MEVGQGPNWGCSDKEMKLTNFMLLKFNVKHPYNEVHE
jgi:hypothetical protein